VSVSGEKEVAVRARTHPVCCQGTGGTAAEEELGGSGARQEVRPTDHAARLSGEFIDGVLWPGARHAWKMQCIPSLRAARHVILEPRFYSHSTHRAGWGHAQVYPLIAFVFCAVVGATFFAGYKSITAPDVRYATGMDDGLGGP
jgi:hypothetical protein